MLEVVLEVEVLKVLEVRRCDEVRSLKVFQGVILLTTSTAV